MVAPVLRESAFVLACAALAGGCLAVAVAVWARHFLRELSEQFIRLPPTSKAVLVAAIVVATVFAQKPTSASTNQSESAEIEANLSEVSATLNTEDEEDRRHGEGEEWWATNQHESARIEICEDPCQSVDKNSSELRASVSPCETIVSSNDVVRGYRLETVRTNEAISYTRPANARLVGTWHLTDAYRGRAWVLLGEEGKGKREKGRSADGQLLPSSLFLFPLGPHVVTSLWAHTWGKVRPQLRNASNEIAVIGAPMFARHDQSFLWTAATTNGSVLLTWENFFLGNPYKRVYNPPVNAQLELFPNGNFIARSNSVERVYRRVNPDDWDDDGIPNDADDAPLAPAGAPQFGPHQTLPEGANSNAYCWVDLVVRQANALVTFTGDGASNLADPSFIAETDATNRVTLLIGKTYRVTCPMPFEVAAKSSDDIEDSWEEDGAALWLHWPVRIEGKSAKDEGRRAERQRPDVATEISGQHKRLGTSALLPSSLLLLPSRRGQPPRTFTMQVSPIGIGGAFTWTNVCCRISGSGYTFSITCGDSCSCGGCSATGNLEYEGYRLPAYGGYCGCSGSVDNPGDDQDPDKDPPLPGASATFSKRVVFFEDDYENAPGETVPWRSTETELDCWAYGGTRGGHVRIEIRGADGLVQYGGSPLPFECDLEPGEEVTFKNTYRAVRPSGGEDDIVVTATFTENETDWSQTTIDKATAVKVELETVASIPENRTRHIYGVGERVYCRNTPDVPCQWTVASPAEVGESFGVCVLQCPFVMASLDLTVTLDGCSYAPTTRLVEPSAVVCPNAVALDFGLPAGHAGGVGLRLDLYVSPDNVSFSGLALQEIPANGTHDGYFNSLVFTNIWNHTKGRKAGQWKAISPDNFYMTDDACLGDEMPRLCSDGTIDGSDARTWSDGRIVWPIPMGWQSRDACDTDLPELKRMGRSYAQVFKIDSDGTTSVEKHGFEAVRGTNTVIRLLKRNGE